MQATGWGISDRGRVRQHNEDDWLADDDLGLYVVCDGMGGHNAGDVAARVTIEAIDAAVRAEQGTIDAVRDGRGSTETLQGILGHALQEACGRVFERARASAKLQGMGCTATALLVAGDHAALGHVGDSRLYLVRRGRAHQLSRDHTIAAEMRETQAGGRTDDATYRAFEHVLTRTIGTQHTVLPDTAAVFLLPGDHLVLCTDGSWTGPGGRESLELLLADAAPEDVPRLVVEAADRAGGADNTTVVVVTLGGEALHPTDLASRDRAIEALADTEIFGQLSHRQRSMLVASGTLSRYRPGEVILATGDVVDDVLVTVDGSAEIGAGTSDRSAAGSVLGWSRLASHQAPSGATVHAVEATTVLELPTGKLRQLAWRRPWLGVHVFARIAALHLNGLRDEV